MLRHCRFEIFWLSKGVIPLQIRSYFMSWKEKPFDFNFPDDKCDGFADRFSESGLAKELDKYINELDNVNEEEEKPVDDCPIDIQWDSSNQIFIIDGVPVSPELLKQFVHAGEEGTDEVPNEDVKGVDDDLPF
jgi:hypothetical protein